MLLILSPQAGQQCVKSLCSWVNQLCKVKLYNNQVRFCQVCNASMNTLWNWYLMHAVEGEEVQDALLAITRSRTVPQVFIRGEFIGGCDGKCIPAILTPCLTSISALRKC